LASVNLANDSTLTFSTRNKIFWDSGQFGDDSGDRVVALADVPITGGGSIALSNDNVNVFGVIVRSGANTATGSASVVEPAAGKGATTLYFASGANWAGTVVADGNVALTNLVNAAAPTTNSFGTLDLEVDLPARVRKENGAIVANDVLNVGAFSGTGRLVPTIYGSGEFKRGDSFILGTTSESGALPNLPRGWTANRIDDGNGGFLLEISWPERGFMTIIK